MGIFTSQRTKSTSSSLIFCKPSAPSWASITSYFSYSKISLKEERIKRSSSIIRIFAIVKSSKKVQVYKPGSVARHASNESNVVLLLPFISILVHTKTPSIYPPRNSFPKKRYRTSSSLPEAYLIFQPIRFAMPSPSLQRRWALTPPFHPFP